MAGDTDAVNERLAGLVNLLQVVGIDGVDSNALTKNGGGSGGGRASGGGGGGDNQILELIRKLQHAQADSPEILAALQSPELRALATLAAAQQQASGSTPTSSSSSSNKKSSLDDVMDDDDDNYPKIGPGYSDDISVVSDMTTPTVMTKQDVADEEHYSEVGGGPGSLPPAHIGMGVPANKNAQQPARPTNVFAGAPGHGGHHGQQRGGGVVGHGGKPNHLAGGPKTKNRVGQVRPTAARNAIAKSGGAAAQRRMNYQQAMQKLQTAPQSGTGVTASSRGPTGQQSAAGTPYASADQFTSPKKQKESYTPTSPTPSQDPMEFPSMASNTPGSLDSKTKKKAKSKSLLSRKKKDKSLAAQEESDFDFEGTDPIRAPPTPSGGVSGVGTGSKKKVAAAVAAVSSSTSNNASGNDADWGNGWSAFDNGNGSGTGTGSFSGSNDNLFGNNDGFFPTDAFNSNEFQSSGDEFQSPSARSLPVKKKIQVGGSHDKSENRASRKSGKPKKDGDAKRDKDKSEKKKKSRRASLSM